jgi:hypothetical protein
MMNQGRVVGTWVAIFACVIVAVGELSHAAKTDPAHEVHGPAYGAVRGIVIPPFNR